MQAIAYRGPDKIRAQSKDMPTISSDLHHYHAMMPDTRGVTTFGHEFIGVVEEVGPSVVNLTPGDRVMVSFTAYCGSRSFCACGLYSHCHNDPSNMKFFRRSSARRHLCAGCPATTIVRALRRR